MCSCREEKQNSSIIVSAPCTWFWPTDDNLFHNQSHCTGHLWRERATNTFLRTKYSLLSIIVYQSLHFYIVATFSPWWMRRGWVSPRPYPWWAGSWRSPPWPPCTGSRSGSGPGSQTSPQHPDGHHGTSAKQESVTLSLLLLVNFPPTGSFMLDFPIFLN